MGDGTDLAQIPDGSVAPEVGTLPDYYGEINNLAGDEELAKKVLGWVGTQFEHFSNQEARCNFTDTDGVMDTADKMYRVSLNKDTSSAQYQDSLSDVASTMFFRQTRAVTAGETQVFFGTGELPARYEPMQDTNEYTAEDGKEIAEQQNLLEQYTFDNDDRVPNLKRTILFNNKYGQYMLSVEWNRVVEQKTERIPIEWEVDEEGVQGAPIKFKFETVERVTKDLPSLYIHDLKDCYFDAQIGDMNIQRCFIKFDQVGYESLALEQASGQIMNLKNVTNAQLYRNEPGTAETFENRTTNAGESSNPETTGLLKRFHAWCRIPVKETGQGTGEWDWVKNAAQLYWCTFMGEINGGAVCTRMIKNPYHHGELPYKLIHALDDDKGAYHMSPASILTPNYWQATTNINQAIDNVTLRNRQPYITDGLILTPDLTFKANKLIKTARGVKLEPITVPDTTKITLLMQEFIERDSDKTTGADKPITGEALGSRTSATEAKNVFDQAAKPLVAKATYTADQIFPWMYRLDAALWRQYGDPKKVITITHNNMIHEIKPAELWGPLKVKVTAITNFENNTLRRQEINSFLGTSYPQAAEQMGESGKRVFWREVFTTFGFDRVNEIFPADGDYDARHIAINENHDIIIVGVPDEPRPDENHAAHLAVHEPAMRQYELLPDADSDPERMRMMRNHIQIHKDMQQQSESQAQQLTPQPEGGAEAPPQEAGAGGLVGEVTGERIAAEEGAAVA